MYNEEEVSVKEMKPHLDLSEKDLPAIKDWKVGTKYTIVLEVEMTSIRKSEFEKNNPISACFSINSVKTTSGNKKKYENRVGGMY